MVERYALRERLAHAVAALSYVYLLLTGLAFWTPGLYWLATVLGGGYLSRVLHPWAGFLFIAAVAWMGRAWHAEMRVSDEDRRWRRSIVRYIRNEDSFVPGAGRFNYGQKMLFWVMAWGGILLLVSGLVMWFVAYIPPALLWMRAVATIVHALAALITIGAFIVHVYMGVAVVPGGVSAIVRGTVSEEWARHHHRRWSYRSPATHDARVDR